MPLLPLSALGGQLGPGNAITGWGNTWNPYGGLLGGAGLMLGQQLAPGGTLQKPALPPGQGTLVPNAGTLLPDAPAAGDQLAGGQGTTGEMHPSFTNSDPAFAGQQAGGLGPWGAAMTSPQIQQWLQIAQQRGLPMLAQQRMPLSVFGRGGFGGWPGMFGGYYGGGQISPYDHIPGRYPGYV